VLGARQHGVELFGPQRNPQGLEVLKDLLAQFRRRRYRRRCWGDSSMISTTFLRGAP
jgi:hypothetical protein